MPYTPKIDPLAQRRDENRVNVPPKPTERPTQKRPTAPPANSLPRELPHWRRRE